MTNSSSAPAEPGAASPSKRVRASEARKVARGGRRLSGVLPPEAAAKLDQLLAANYAGSAIGVIARALLDVKP